MHGGRSLAGVAHPNLKTGRWSKHFPSRLRAKYEEAQADPELLALREDIALVDARTVDLLKRVDSGESGALWKQLQTAWRAYSKADAGDNPDQRAAAFDTLADLILRGHTDHAAWSEITQLLEQRRKLSEAEWKRLVDMQQIITAEQAMVFVSAVSDAVRRHVDDRDTLAAIAKELQTLTGLTSRSASETAG